MKEPIIVCEGLSYSYESVSAAVHRAAVSDVNLTIEKGSFVVILGRNGSGKSTLAKLFNGILTPDKGRVIVAGMDTSVEENLLPIRRRVGMVFQNPDNQLVSNIVEEDVAFGPENLGIASEEIRTRVDEALKQVKMQEFARHSPHKLSGGQKQRVAIAGILAMRPECILFDESTAMLDPLGRQEIMETILRLNREEGITCVLITHHMDEATLADRVVVMESGRVLRDGTPREIFSDVPFLHAVGLDAPQVTELVHLIWEKQNTRRSLPYPQGILQEEEAADWILNLFEKE